MFGWGRRPPRTADAEESDDVNLLSADELSNASALGVPQTTPDGPPPPLLLPPTDDPPPPVVHLQDRDSGGPPTVAARVGDGRGRHRSGRRHRHHVRHRLCRCKRKEGNFLTAISCMFVVVLVCTSLAEPHWFYLIGGKCVDCWLQPVNYLGVKLFFYPGYFKVVHDASTTLNVYHYGSADNEVLIDCVTPSLVLTMRIIIALCALAIVFSLVAFVLHLLGSSHRVLRMLRVNAIFSIVSVLICITINGLSYLAVEQLTNHFQMNPFREGSRIDVEFSLGFYMITTAGVVSIVGVACNLLRRTASHSRREHRDQIPFRPPPPADLHQSFCSQLAPPPYTP